MNSQLIEIANRIKSADNSARPAHVKALIAKADALGESLTMEDVDAVVSALSPIGELEDLRAKLHEEKNPERIRTLMASAMKLRNNLRATAK